MPKVGMEPIRRAALVEATIAEIGAARSLDVTVGRIAKRAGMSPALAFHYFGGKEDMLLAAMRHIMRLYSAEVRGALSMARTRRGRVEAIVRAGFAAQNFRPEVVAAWLNFYVLAMTSDGAARLLSIYRRRLRSNLVHALRGMSVDPVLVADRIAALIDGLYLRSALGGETAEQATCHVLALIDREV